MDENKYAVTISHQLGSGGAYIGERLAGRLGIPFLDRDILKEVARQLDLAEAELEHREERLSSFWERFTRLAILTDPVMSVAAQRIAPTDSVLFDLECATIQRIAEKSSAIFLGRCGWYVLRNHPHHVSILVTADPPARIKRLRELYKLSEAVAVDLIKTNDQERKDYIRTFTRQNWLDARHYDLCVNTSSVGWDCAVDLAEKCLRTRLQLLN
ncbi:MAG: AAA family ATPase [Omnitrophica WOR_2 bacterium]